MLDNYTQSLILQQTCQQLWRFNLLLPFGGSAAAGVNNGRLQCFLLSFLSPICLLSVNYPPPTLARLLWTHADFWARANTHATESQTPASDLSACQLTKRLHCLLITPVQPPRQEAVSLTSLAHGRSSEWGADSWTMPSLLQKDHAHKDL